MKMRLGADEINIRISRAEFDALKSQQQLNGHFILSERMKVEVEIQVSSTSSFVSTEKGFIVTIENTECLLQKTKRDTAFSIPILEGMVLVIDVDLVKREKFQTDTVVG